MQTEKKAAGSKMDEENDERRKEIQLLRTQIQKEREELRGQQESDHKNLMKQLEKEASDLMGAVKKEKADREKQVISKNLQNSLTNECLHSKATKLLSIISGLSGCPQVNRMILYFRMI